MRPKWYYFFGWDRLIDWIWFILATVGFFTLGVPTWDPGYLVLAPVAVFQLVVIIRLSRLHYLRDKAKYQN